MTEPHDRSAGQSGDWAELALVVLEPAGRAPDVPADTGATPYGARVKGFLEEAAAVGSPAAVRTLAGRRVEGTLVRLDPAPDHSFGEPVRELFDIGVELRERLGVEEPRA